MVLNYVIISVRIQRCHLGSLIILYTTLGERQMIL